MKPQRIVTTVLCLIVLSIVSACRHPAIDRNMQAQTPAHTLITLVASADVAAPAVPSDPHQTWETVTWCPPGIDPSDTIHCPTLAVTREMHEAIEAATHRDRNYSAVCPTGMREINGSYCAHLEHECKHWRSKITIVFSTDGRSSHKIEDPHYFCDSFVPNSAKCTGPEKPMHLCIDEYEFPNQPGEPPTIMNSWYDAHALCAREGKRLCTDQEWTLSCEGPERKPYPYGWERDATACNIDNPSRRDGIETDHRLMSGSTARKAELARLWSAKPIASSPRCVSDYGVQDMAGNVDEVTDNVTLGGKPYKDLWKGGHWVSGARNRCRPYTEGHNEAFGYYANGFRCCADPAAPH